MHITGDPTGMRSLFGPGMAPAYPQGEERRQHTGVPVIAFVVDTTGRVEPESATFLNDTPPEFERAVCDVLPRLRFQPLSVGGEKMRVLFVDFFGFNTLATPDTAGLHAARELARAKQEEFGTQPIVNVIPQLMVRPHCTEVPSARAERSTHAE